MDDGVTFNWSPGIGDPTLVGWLTVVAYFITAGLCLRAFKAQKQTPDHRQGWRAYVDAMRSLLALVRRRSGPLPPPARRAAWWLILAGIFVLLGINKQLDLQSFVTELGRWLAHRQGWYEHRQMVQVAFMATAILTGGVGLVALTWLGRDQLRAFGTSIVGLVFILTFVAVRASSFAHMDTFIGFEILGVRMNWLLELGGIALVGWAAWRAKETGRR